ncbi:hypothetical protein [uncultured Jannaschia sp.]|uniref:hypothetical protein n=1 Tax=uncultured Jannaschia sp. TaxID=293347 RepID=UPI00261B2654|nr:hypothetical protein [uncultured Jannaschia sp.]
MPIIVILIVGAWFVFGDPPKTVANWFWSDGAAPWEEVDAYYYPDRSNLTSYQAGPGLRSVQECRDWVNAAAAANGDASLVRGDYECAVEQVDSFAGGPVYRLTVR